MICAEAVACPHGVEGDCKFPDGHNVLFRLPQVPHLVPQLVQDRQGRRHAEERKTITNMTKYYPGILNQDQTL